MEGPIGDSDTDNNVLVDMMAHRPRKDFGKHFVNDDVHKRTISGTCSVCAVPSSCMHNERMESKGEGAFRENYLKKEADNCSSVNCEVEHIYKSGACDDGEHATSVGSNFSASYTHDLLSENAESNAAIKNSANEFGSSQPSTEPDQVSDNYTEPDALEYDNLMSKDSSINPMDLENSVKNDSSSSRFHSPQASFSKSKQKGKIDDVPHKEKAKRRNQHNNQMDDLRSPIQGKEKNKLKRKNSFASDRPHASSSPLTKMKDLTDVHHDGKLSDLANAIIPVSNKGSEALSKAKIHIRLPNRSSIPERLHIWKGSFEIHTSGILRNFSVGCKAHFSTNFPGKYPQKVFEVASEFPVKLELEFETFDKSWPSQFRLSAPTEDCIGLFFFAIDSDSHENYIKLVEYMMRNNLALKRIFDMFKLIIYPSIKLDERCRRWNNFVFLWGVFIEKGQNKLCTIGYDDRAEIRTLVAQEKKLIKRKRPCTHSISFEHASGSGHRASRGDEKGRTELEHDEIQQAHPLAAEPQVDLTSPSKLEFTGVPIKMKMQKDAQGEARPPNDATQAIDHARLQRLHSEHDGFTGAPFPERAPPANTVPLGYEAPHSASRLFELSQNRDYFYDEEEWNRVLQQPLSHLGLGRYMVSLRSTTLDRALYFRIQETEAELGAARERLSALEQEKVREAQARTKETEDRTFKAKVHIAEVTAAKEAVEKEAAELRVRVVQLQMELGAVKLEGDTKIQELEAEVGHLKSDLKVSRSNMIKKASGYYRDGFDEGVRQAAAVFPEVNPEKVTFEENP